MNLDESNNDKNFKNKILKSLDDIKSFSKENLNILHTQREKLEGCNYKLNNINDDINLSKKLINSMSGAIPSFNKKNINSFSKDIQNFNKNNSNQNKIKIKKNTKLIQHKIEKIKELFFDKFNIKSDKKLENNQDIDKINSDDDEDFDLIIESIKELKKYNDEINSELSSQDNIICKNINKTDNNEEKLKSNIKKINKIIDN